MKGILLFKPSLRAATSRSALSRSALVRSGRIWLAAALLAGVMPVAAEARDVITIAKPFEVGESSVGNYLAALVAGADRDTLAAATFFREALRADPGNGELLERTFVAALSNGDTAESFDFARRLIAIDPKNGLSHLVLGVEQLKDKHYVAARRQLATNGAGRERDVTATLLTAWTWAGQGDEKKALAAVDTLTDSNLGVFRDYHAALIADLMGDVPEASKRFGQAYAADKTILRLTDAYGRFLARHGDTAKATTIFSAFNDVLPHHPLIEAALNDLRANKPLTPLIRTPQEGAGEVLYGLGAAGGRQGDDLAAMIYLRLSLYLAPDNSLVMVTLADTYARLKQNEAAIDVYQTVPTGSPLRSNADIQTALTLDTLGRSDDAITSYTAAIDATGPTDKSLWGLLYFRGIAYERNKDWPKAEDDFKRALTLYPDQPLVLNYLGYSWIDQGIHLDEGFRMLRRAVALRPEDGYIVDSLGWAHFKLGEYDEAVKDLERAITLKPSDPTINDHLGDAYWRVGRKLEAQFQWNHARDLNPEADDLQKILAKIKDGLPDEKLPTAAENGKPAPAATPAPSQDAAPAEPPKSNENNGG